MQLFYFDRLFLLQVVTRNGEQFTVQNHMVEEKPKLSDRTKCGRQKRPPKTGSGSSLSATGLKSQFCKAILTKKKVQIRREGRALRAKRTKRQQSHQVILS